MLFFALVLSVLGLAVGPTLVALGRGRRFLGAWVEGFALGVVPALLLLRLVPHVVEGAGALGVVLVAVGFGLLWWADQRNHALGHAHDDANPGAERAAAWVVGALVLHALSDGAGLAMAVGGGASGAHEDHSLGLAVLIHRLPEGLFLTTAFLPRLGWPRTLARLALLGAGTVAGALLGRGLLSVVPDAFFDGVVALGAGAMLRLSVHSHNPMPRTPGARAASAVGLLMGLGLAVFLPDPESLLRRAQADELSTVEALVPLVIETSPAALVGILWTALLRPPRATPAVPPGRLTRALMGLRLAVTRPGWSGRSLEALKVTLGGPGGVALAVTLGTALPLFEPVGLSLLFRLLGPAMGGVRVLGAALASLAAGLAASAVASREGFRRVHPRAFSLRPGALKAATVQEPTGFGARLLGALDAAAPWYVTGLTLAVALEAAVDPRWVARLPGGLTGALLGALVGVPVYLSQHAAVLVVAVLVHKGLSPGAGLALLVTASALDRGRIAAVRQRLGLWPVVAWVLVVVAAAAGLGALGDRWVGRATVPEVHLLVAHRHAPAELVAATLLAAGLLVSLVRNGPRRWFGMLQGDNVAP